MNKLFQEFMRIFREGADDLTVVAYMEAMDEAIDFIVKPLALEFDITEAELQLRVNRVKAKLKKRLEDALGEDPVDPTDPVDPVDPVDPTDPTAPTVPGQQG
jgi:predicted metal-dependent phosphoesterase TrpH